MTFPIRALCAVAIVACLAPACGRSAQARADERTAPTGGVAVVELFTSEGCSSCPPAEGVLQELADAARRNGRRIFALEFHVDYWDGLGWPDRFASQAFSARQRAYARAFGESGVYTPEMVVGGVEHFVGSDRSLARDGVARSLARREAVRITLQPTPEAPDALEVRYDVAGSWPRGAVIAVALVQRSATVRVTAGENAGKVLHHTGVVRVFARSPLEAPRGIERLVVPSGVSADDAEVIAFVQSESNGTAILGAAAASLN